MALGDLKAVQIEAGIIFGQECYLDEPRAHEFLSKVNESFPNFFTRYDFKPLPNRFALENSSGTRRCLVWPNRFNYSVNGPIEPTNFLNEVEKSFDCFRYLFAINDVRRIGKIYDLQFPASLPKELLSNIVKIKEPVQVNNMQLLFREEKKNINIHFQPLDRGIIEIEGRKIDVLEPGVIVRCDINNIHMGSPLDVPEKLREIFEFTDCYVQTDLVNFLNEYFGDTQ